MKIASSGIALAGVLIIFQAGAAWAQKPPTLTADELAQCASQVNVLRRNSERLKQQAIDNDLLRSELTALRDAASQSPGNSLVYNARAAAFKEHMSRFRGYVTAINEVKRRYDENCANRHYRRVDMDSLPLPHQVAMHAGLAGVQIPPVETEASGSE